MMKSTFTVPKPLEYWVPKGMRVVKRSDGREFTVRVWSRRDVTKVELDAHGRVKPIQHLTKNEAISDSAKHGLVATFVVE